MHRPPLSECPYCHSKEGLYSNFKGQQFYGFSGEPQGFSTEAYTWSESDVLRCIHCGKTVTKRSWIDKMGGNSND